MPKKSLPDMIIIAFENGGLLPFDVLKAFAPEDFIKAGKDLPVPPHRPVMVPTEYGRQLIRDKFAYDGTALADAAEANEAAKQGAAEAAALSAAQRAVDDATIKVDAATDDAAKKVATAELKAATDTLAALKA